MLAEDMEYNKILGKHCCVAIKNFKFETKSKNLVC